MRAGLARRVVTLRLAKNGVPWAHPVNRLGRGCDARSAKSEVAAARVRVGQSNTGGRATTNPEAIGRAIHRRRLSEAPP